MNQLINNDVKPVSLKARGKRKKWYWCKCLMPNCPDRYTSDLDMRAHVMKDHGRYIQECSTGIGEHRFLKSLAQEWNRRKEERARTKIGHQRGNTLTNVGRVNLEKLVKIFD